MNRENSLAQVLIFVDKLNRIQETMKRHRPCLVKPLLAREVPNSCREGRLTTRMACMFADELELKLKCCGPREDVSLVAPIYGRIRYLAPLVDAWLFEGVAAVGMFLVCCVHVLRWFPLCLFRVP